MEQYITTGRFPGFDFVDDASGATVSDGFIETDIRPKKPFEVLRIFTVPAIAIVFWHVAMTLLRVFR